MPVLQEQTARALADELKKLNNPPAYRRYFDRLTGSVIPVENAAREWQIEFHRTPTASCTRRHPDPFGADAAGASDDLGAGQRTRRITTVHVGQRTTRREETVSRTATASSTPHARLQYEDNGGPHMFDIVRDSIVIGRGGIAYRADVRIDSSVDVSREHARIRRDPGPVAFFIIDLSTLGTTVNGRRLPKATTRRTARSARMGSRRHCRPARGSGSPIPCSFSSIFRRP